MVGRIDFGIFDVVGRYNQAMYTRKGQQIQEKRTPTKIREEPVTVNFARPNQYGHALLIWTCTIGYNEFEFF